MLLGLLLIDVDCDFNIVDFGFDLNWGVGDVGSGVVNC